ncbi:MAG: hypothetical protein M9894_24345 [Planctomycetes bacterium]|nr:hypothetical protein [Planctomycetota bacterium]
MNDPGQRTDGPPTAHRPPSPWRGVVRAAGIQLVVAGSLALAFAAQGDVAAALALVVAPFALVALAMLLLGATPRARGRRAGPALPAPEGLDEALRSAASAALPEPELDDPTAHLLPLAPGEELVWTGRPGRAVWRVLCRRRTAEVVTAAAAPPVLLGLVGLVGPPDVWASGDAVRVWVVLLLSAAALTPLGVLALAWAGSGSTTYVLTTRRGLVVSPAGAHVCDLEPGALRVEGASLRLGAATPRCVARGRYPWSLPALRWAGTPRASFEALEDPASVLAELRRAWQR